MHEQNQEALARISGLSHQRQVLPPARMGSTGEGTCAVKAPQQLSATCSLKEIFVTARAQDASDVHLSPNFPITFRRFQSLTPQTEETLSQGVIKKIIEEAIDPSVLAEFGRTGDVEFIYIIEGAGRFRVTLMKQRAGWDLTARLIPMNIRSFAESLMPESCANLTKWSQGMILITGPSGCGKSSTLSTLAQLINETRHEHIITIENPVEVVYTPKNCQITKREINHHTLSQANALRAALREDPDVLIVSELRDLKSIQLAVSAAETGHLVLGTMNTVNATQTISRLIYSFPPEEQPV